ncbi:MAG: DMT family transporter, partial [Candidatus Neomarinimicrobiota bacterium]
VLLISKISFFIKKRDILLIFSNSLFMVSYNYFYFKGTQVGLAGAGGVLVTTLNPVLTLLVSSIIYHTNISTKDIFGLTCGMIGGGLIIRIWQQDMNSLFQSGNLFFIFASISWVSVTIITSYSRERLSFMSYSFWSFSFAFLLSIPLALEQNLMSVFEFDWIFWINLLFLSCIAMSFGTSIYFLASSKLGPKKASAYIFLVPLSAMGFAMIILSEPLQTSTLFGGILGIYAVYLINK